MTSDEEARRTVAELVEAAKIAYVTTVTPEGQLVSRPLGVQLRGKFDGDLWFFTADPSNKTARCRSTTRSTWPSRPTTATSPSAAPGTVSHDRAVIDELWNSGAEAWFEGGKDDPHVALLQVHAESAEYWTLDQPKAVTMLKYAKAMITGERPDVGTNESVDL